MFIQKHSLKLTLNNSLQRLKFKQFKQSYSINISTSTIDRVNITNEFLKLKNGMNISCDIYKMENQKNNNNNNINSILFMHGGGQTRSSWTKTAQRLVEIKKDISVYAVDLRGHGETDRAPANIYSIESFIEDFHNTLELIPSPKIVVGASLGGIIALLYEGNYKLKFSNSQSVNGLVLVDIAPKLESSGLQRIVGFMQSNPDGFESIEQAAEFVASYLPHRKKPTDFSGLAKNLRYSNGRFRWHWDPYFLEWAKTYVDQNSEMHYKMREAAKLVQCPCMLVRGSKSDLLTLESVKEFGDLVPHAKVVDVVDAHHMVAGDTNDAFTDSIIQFILEIDK
eukprot:TRINITY_DN930_c0_g1_i1.p1 TRINITY_DN930_c0_g1~~TRINITY_DN930_c0_g1_i1.p1  ORF type:complete len:338 (-),score=140.72 TRINITY_DN930_c0_g1_i1:85-1098(-)